MVKANKQIRPYLVQLCMYLGVFLAAVLLLHGESTLWDKLLTAAIGLFAVGYGILRGRVVLRTHYAVKGDTLYVTNAGSLRTVKAESISLAYYDSNTKNMELQLNDGSSVMLVEYDNLAPAVTYLEQQGIRIEYKRIALK
ncbi:MAG: hypothetical protein E7328_07615 [Clostridiales bacterium]|nr:hypothetical protein [Clostridiales bacterium]